MKFAINILTIRRTELSEVMIHDELLPFAYSGDLLEYKNTDTNYASILSCSFVHPLHDQGDNTR